MFSSKPGGIPKRRLTVTEAALPLPRIGRQNAKHVPGRLAMLTEPKKRVFRLIQAEQKAIEGAQEIDLCVRNRTKWPLSSQPNVR
jgi:hypothetical protein